MWHEWNEYREGSNPLGRSVAGVLHKIKMDVRAVMCGCLYWTKRSVDGSCEHCNEPSGLPKCENHFSGCTAGNFTGRAQLRGYRTFC
jgi:hypothetical protein